MQVQHSQLAQDLIWLNVINIVMKNRKIILFHPINKQTDTTKNFIKKISLPVAGLLNQGLG